MKLRRTAALAAILLLCATASVFAQNTLTEDTNFEFTPPITEGPICPGEQSIPSPLYWRFQPNGGFLEWCAPDNAESRAQAQSFVYRVYADDTPFTLTNVECVDEMPMTRCSTVLPEPVRIVMRTAGEHELEITAALDSVAPESPRGQPTFQVSDAATCSYATLGAPNTMMQRPRFDDDPVNGTLQGFNPLPGQAARKAQLNAWGWKVGWQFIPADRGSSDPLRQVDRIFMMAQCIGVPQQ